MVLLTLVSQAQPQALLQEADRQLTLHAYGRSIELYTQLLSDFNTVLKPEQRIAAQASLAFAYKAAGDLQKAENTYRDLIGSGPLPADLSINYLHFAQVLASNGKYRESQAMFEKYNTLKGQQTARKSAAMAPASVGQGAPGTKKIPTKYRLEILELNTKNAEFSPMYFREGLLFVSGKKGGSAIETSGSGGGGGYLDLFYMPNRQDLRIDKIVKADGTVTKAPAQPAPKKEKSLLGGDYYTRATANDSRTLNYAGSYNVTGGLGYQKPGTVQRFDKEINTRYHEGPATFFSDGSRIIFTRNNYNGGRVRQSAEGVTNLKLYTAEQQNGTWVNVQELPINSNEYSVGHPALSKDDQLLFFASDMPGGFGGTDLYVSRYTNGQWSKPVNLGRQVNTKGNELFPFVDEVGNLYFSSDGQKGGLGGLDVYCAYMTNGTQATQIEHLEAPVNSDKDDFGLITDEFRRTGFLSTNRFNDSDDIVRFVRESSLYGCRNLTLRLYDEESNMPLDSVVVEVQSRTDGQPTRTLVTKTNGLAQLCLEGNSDFILRSSKDGFMTSTVGFSTQGMTDDSPSRLEIALFRPKELADTVQLSASAPSGNDGWGVVDPKKSRIRGVVMSERDRKPIEGVVVRLKNECDGMVQQVVTSADGRYEFELTENCEFTLIAAKERYGTNTNRIRKLPRRTPPKVLSADLKMLRVGDIVELDNIYYDLDQWTIRPDAARELDKLVATMRKYPTLSVEIRSHTDSRGENTYNRYLSAQRASSVVNYLASKGISRKRLVAAGYGETMPVNNCVDGVICTEAEYQRNRRTEFKVLAIK